MRHLSLVRRVLVIAAAALAASAVPALADAPDPIPSATELTPGHPIVTHPDGSFTVTVDGAWQWPTHKSNCNQDRSGVGYAIAWNDPSNPGNFVGKNNLSALVGTTATTGPDIHDGNLAHAAMPGNDPGLGPMSVTYSVANNGGIPTQIDANNWVSSCGTFNGTFNTGTWGPISHTYPANFSGPIVICPIMYDPHQGPSGTANGQPGQITAGGGHRNGDNSIESNGDTPLGNGCFSRTIPRVATSTASTASLGTPITDTATISGGNNPTGTITFQLFGPNDATCSTTPIFTSSAVPVNGNGNYTSSPTFAPTALGTYRWIATYSGDANNVKVPTGCGDAGEQVTITQASPTLTTTASSNGAIGTAVHDTAHLAAATTTASGTITFKLYGPNDATCAQTAIFTTTATVSGNGDYPSAAFTPGAAGTYRWIASYGGDAANKAVTTSCNDANESVSITPAGPSLTTTASATGPVGTALNDTAHLTGATSAAGGSIVFKLYGPNDGGCALGAIFQTSVSVSGNNDYPSASFTPTQAGTYRWIASYGGDANNNPVATACNDANEATLVSPVTPLLTTTASAGGGVGAGVHDTAHLTAATSGASGTITFKLYGPNDTNCSQGAIFTTTTSVSGSGDYASSTFIPSTAGAYRWIASYGGDSNNNPATTACNDANESVTITQLTPALTTTASGPGAVGTAISDTAHLSGGSNPHGSITFSLYGPNDANCSQGAIFTTTNSAIAGAGDYSTPSSFTPSDAGTYRWIARYNGDVNNAPVATLCGDAGETVTIGPASPAVTTTASGNGAVGTAVHDTAHLTGATGNATGTIVFNLYGPNDAACSHSAVFTTSIAVAGSGDYRSPTPDFTPTTAGTYRWIANYSGDTNNKPATTSCNDANESVTISPVGPSLTTTASGNGGVGTAVHDTGHLTGATNTATGTITFKLYGPNDSTCSQGAIFTTSTTVSGNSDYRSPTPDFSPTQAGVYRWIASYSGDTNNTPTATSCNDANESVTISPLTPVLTTTASANGALGTAISDTGHLTGGANPTGSITFRLYGPNDGSCAQAAVFTTTNSGVAGTGDYSTPSSFTPTQTGTYRWIATYNGDNNNGSVATSCGDAGETVVISPVTPTLTTTASNGTAIAGIDPISDVAHLSGGSNPGGSITFTAYGPTDTNCAGPAVFQSNVPVSGNGNYASSASGSTFVPTAAGTYRWIASYSGDSHNAAVPTACNDANESSVVTPAAPAIALTKLQTIAGSGNGFTHNDISGSPGQTVDYQMNVTNTGNVPLALTFTDQHCDSGTISGPALISGTLGANNTLSAGGQVRYTCSHLISAADAPVFTNEADVSGQPPTGSPVTAKDSVNLDVVLHPNLTIVKSQRDGSNGSFTTATITGQPGDTINYSTLVTNTGDTPLLLNFSDPKCDSGTLSGPIGGSFDGSGRLLPSSSVTYTCLHVLLAADAPSFTNTATVSGTTPQNQTVGPFSSSVTVNVQLTPAISVVKLEKIDGSDSGYVAGPITGAVGQRIDYEIQSTNTGDLPLALSLTDAHCDAGTVTGPTLVSGTLSNGVLSPGSVAAYFCSHVLAAGDAPQFTNVGTITGTPPSGPPVQGTGIVVTNVLVPGLNVVKMQRIAGTTAPFTTGILTATVGQTILYQMTVNNTGDLPLTLNFSDPHCDAGTLTGPVGGIDANGQLAAHSSTVYNCSHVATAADVPQVTNVVTVTGTPPSGPPVGPVSSTVVANVATGGVSPSCTTGTVALNGTVGCARKAFQAVVQAAPNSVKSVTFFLDGKKVKTLNHVGKGNRWAITVRPGSLRVGGHTLTAHVTLVCNGAKRTVTLHFRHCPPPKPRFTG